MLVVDEHPLLPTDAGVRSALDRLAQRLVKAGAKVARASPLLPDLAESARLYMGLLMAALRSAGPMKPIDARRRPSPRSGPTTAASWPNAGAAR